MMFPRKKIHHFALIHIVIFTTIFSLIFLPDSSPEIENYKLMTETAIVRSIHVKTLYIYLIVSLSASAFILIELYLDYFNKFVKGTIFRNFIYTTIFLSDLVMIFIPHSNIHLLWFIFNIRDYILALKVMYHLESFSDPSIRSRKIIRNVSIASQSIYVVCRKVSFSLVNTGSYISFCSFIAMTIFSFTLFVQIMNQTYFYLGKRSLSLQQRFLDSCIYSTLVFSCCLYRIASWIFSKPIWFDDFTELQLIANYAYFLLFLLVLIVSSKRDHKYDRMLRSINIMKIKTSIVRYINHEVRSPLNIISLGLSSLQQDSLTMFYREICELIKIVKNDYNNTDNYNILLNNLLSINTDISDVLIESQKACTDSTSILNQLSSFNSISTESFMTLNIQQISVYNFIVDVLSIYYLQAKANDVTLICKIDEAINNPLINVTFRIDVLKVKQVLYNLLSNSFKVSPSESEVIVEVKLINQDGPGRVRISVIDRGPQSNENISLQPVGEDFFGMGLYMSYQTVLKHQGGEMGFFSREVGKGSIFYFELPVEMISRQDIPSVTHIQDDQLVSSLPNLRILVVDDVESCRKLLIRNITIKMKPISVDQAVNGQDAVLKITASLACEKPYDLVFMDYEMPVMNGPDATKIARAVGFAGLVMHSIKYLIIVFLIRLLD